MTNIITRYFDSADQARSMVFELVHQRRVSPQIIDVFEASEGLVGKLTTIGVRPETAAAYDEKLSAGGAVLLVRAGIRPLAVAKIARTVADAMGAADMGTLNEEVIIEDGRSGSLSVMTDHLHMVSRPLSYQKKNYYMADWPIPLISRRKPILGATVQRKQSYASWPIGHLLPGSRRFGRFPFDLLVPGHKFMANLPFGHLVPHEKRYGKFPFGLLVPHKRRYGSFPFGLLVPGHKFMAKFPFGHLVPGHGRMANWPFPLLINGKRGTNSLVPGQKFMAKFPFAHLVPHAKRYGRFPFGLLAPHDRRYGRFPFGLLVPGHKFMANFPFGHIVPGHKYMANFPIGHLVPGHKYIANFVLPHTKA